MRKKSNKVSTPQKTVSKVPKSKGVSKRMGNVAPSAPSANGQFFNPYDYQNNGYYRRQFIGNTYVDADKAIDSTDRRQLVEISRKLFSTMGELTAASKQKASWVVGGGFDPIYKGSNKAWGEIAANWLKDKWYPTCNPKGFAYDFKTCLKIASRLLDRDGDLLQVYTKDANGYPLIQYIETHNIGHRTLNNNGVIPDGAYAGHTIVDGVVYDSNSKPIAYYISQGSDEKDDIIISTQDAALLMDAEFFSNGRGLPILSAALGDALNLQEIRFYLSQVVKQESMIQIVETNVGGGAPLEYTTNFATLNNLVPSTTGNMLTDPSNSNSIYNLVPMEVKSGGTSYLKANSGEKLESFKTARPAADTQNFVKGIEKIMLSALGWPHELMLSAQENGGVSTRGIAEMARKTIGERQALLEKYAHTAIIYALSCAMESGLIPKNYTEDYTQWGFSRGAQLVLDAGYERAADLNDYRMGIKSMDDITRKYGKSANSVRDQLSSETSDLLRRAIELNKQYPQFDTNRCLDLLSQRGANYLPSVDTSSDNLSGTE